MDKNNDKLFDDFFSKGFEDENNQIKPEKQEWETLATRLDRHQGLQSSRSWSWFWLLIPFLLLIQAWTVYQWLQTRQKLNSFIETNGQKYTGAITDTPSNAVPTTYYDTIYKTVIIEQKIYRTTSYETKPAHPVEEEVSQKVANPSLNPSATQVLVSDYVNAPQQNDKTEQPFKTSGIKKEEKTINAVVNPAPLVQKTTAENSGNTEDKEKIIQQIPSAAQPTASTEVPVTPSEKEMYPAIQADSVSSQNKTVPDLQGKPDKTLADFMANQKPRSAWDTFLDDIIPDENEHAWRFGISGGSILPMTRGEIDIVNPISFQASLEWVAGKHISVLPSLSYAQYEFEAEQPFLARLGIPQPEEPSANLTFSEAEGIQRYIIPSLQIRYRIRPDKTWTWYAGTGITAFIPLPIDIEYDYVDRNLTEIPTTLNGFKPKTKFACLNLHGGIQYNVNHATSIFADIHTTWDLRKSNRGFHYIMPQLGIKFFIK